MGGRNISAANTQTPDASLAAEPWFESLDALRIVQCDVHHLWRFHPSQSFFITI
jgi:hypothetical protein